MNDGVFNTLFSDKVRLVYLQLPYFTKEVDDCDTIYGISRPSEQRVAQIRNALHGFARELQMV